MKPLQHSLISVRRYGGTFRDYQVFHSFIDSSKAVFASVQHRIFFHSDWGGSVCRRVFGTFLTNSDGASVETDRLFEDHMVEDLGRVVSLGNWLREVRSTPVLVRLSGRFEDVRRDPAGGLARRWGGTGEDFEPLLELMDSPVGYAPKFAETARMLTHSSFGIFLAERILGEVMTVRTGNGEPRLISTRSPLEDLVQARIGRIPRGSELPERTRLTKWMVGSEVARGLAERTRQQRQRIVQ